MIEEFLYWLWFYMFQLLCNHHQAVLGHNQGTKVRTLWDPISFMYCCVLDGNKVYLFFILYFQIDTLLFLSTYNICYILSSTCFRPHRPIIRRSKLYMQPMVFSTSADVEKELFSRVLSQRPHDKDICRGGEYHRLHVQFRPPYDGPVRPETCRGKMIADIVGRQKKNSVSSWK